MKELTGASFWACGQVVWVSSLWMGEIHFAAPEKRRLGDSPCKYQATLVFSGFKVVQDIVHPQFDWHQKCLNQFPAIRKLGVISLMTHIKQKPGWVLSSFLSHDSVKQNMRRIAHLSLGILPHQPDLLSPHPLRRACPWRRGGAGDWRSPF